MSPGQQCPTTRTCRLCLAERSIYDLAKDRFAGRQIRERDIDVQLLTDATENLAARCDLLYISRIAEERAKAFLDSASGEPVLTISDEPDFAESGGMIGLSTRDGKVTIRINVGAYESSNLTVSSQLLELAELINDNRIATR